MIPLVGFGFICRVAVTNAHPVVCTFPQGVVVRPLNTTWSNSKLSNLIYPTSLSSLP